jgi:anti-sigma regulatory factor (Ser/Thr protein kinase)/CheY-like chemotaxis protein
VTDHEAMAAAVGIVLVQSHDARGAGLRQALSRRPELTVVDEVATPNDGVSSAGKHQPGVVVMDVGLDDVAGHSTLRAIREVAPDARVILHAWAAEVDDVPGTRRWTARLVDVVLDRSRGAVLEARLVLADSPESVPVARRFTTDLLRDWELAEYAGSAELVASELVANAVIHVHGPCALELTHFADILRVGVADLGPGMPDLQVLGPSSEGGRGLHIVSAFSTAWGVDHLDDGAKLVWAELNPAGVGAA